MTVSFDMARVQKLLSDFTQLTSEELRKAYCLKADGRDWTVDGAKEDLAHNSPVFVPYLYRPFDVRYTLYTGKSRGFIGYPRDSVMSLMRNGNIALISSRMQTTFPFQHALVTDRISDLNSISMQTGEQSYVFPLYLYSDNMGTLEKTPNFDSAIYAKICERLVSASAPAGEKPTPEDVFHYVYGVLHTPAYREKYREFLKIDFPRIPYPPSAEQFRRIAEIGAKLVRVHLLKDPNVTNSFANPYARFEGEGSGLVDRATFDSDRVYVNAGQYFGNVPQTAWDAYIGGYQPAQKWLKDRKGRVLANDELAHYKAIVFALLETAKLTAQLSAEAFLECEKSCKSTRT